MAESVTSKLNKGLWPFAVKSIPLPSSNFGGLLFFCNQSADSITFTLSQLLTNFPEAADFIRTASGRGAII
jgi:hypothetical protein